MKKVYLVTLCTCLVVIAFVSASVYFLRDEEKEITVGFVYVGDASTAYTSNFIDAQEAIQTKYRDQVKVIALNNVAEGTESEYLQQLVYAGFFPVSVLNMRLYALSIARFPASSSYRFTRKSASTSI